MKNQTKILAATHNPVSQTKILTVMVDIPYVLLPELLQFKELNVSYKKVNIWEKEVFDKTTCIISGTEWEGFFEIFCPKYELHIPTQGYPDPCYEGYYFKSKKDSGIKSTYENPKNWTEEQWQSINKSSAQPEFQVIAEMLYDLYQETDWKENKYHVPFYKEIEEKYYYDACFDFYENKSKITPSIDTYYDARSYSNVGDLEPKIWYDYAMKISASMCAKLSYNTQDNEDTIEKHLDNTKHDYTHIAIPMLDVEYEYWSVSKIIDREEFFKRYNSYHGEKKEEGVISKELGWCDNLKGFKKYK
jgi:hypothetical protein